MSYLLDTNICIYLLDEVPNVVKLFNKNKEKDLAISSITLAELEYGVYVNSSYEQNRKKLFKLIKLIEILPFDESAAMHYGIIRADLMRKKRNIGPFDMLIAAHAKSLKRILATNNERDFKLIDGLAIENWLK